jgi:hypothetical protein
MIKKVMVALVMMVSINHASLAHALEIGQELGVAYYTWKEDTRFGTVKESGPIWTLGWSLSSVSQDTKMKGHGNLEIFWGTVDYDTVAVDQFGNFVSFVNTDTSYLGFKIEGSTGWPIVLRSRDENEEIGADDPIQGQDDIETSETIEDKNHIVFTVEPFVGLAFRMWDRVIENSDVAAGGIELYRNLYARIGVSATQALNESMTIYETVSADPMLWAREKADAGGVLSFKNGRKVGWEIEAGARFRTVNIAAYWQATRLGKSDVVSGFFQPKSDQDIIGLKFGYLF